MNTRSSPRIEVVAGIIRREGRFLICKRPEGDVHPGLWEFPGGKIEIGESPEGALVREIREELDIDVTYGRVNENFLRVKWPKVITRVCAIRSARNERELKIELTKLTG